MWFRIFITNKPKIKSLQNKNPNEYSKWKVHCGSEYKLLTTTAKTKPDSLKFLFYIFTTNYEWDRGWSIKQRTNERKSKAHKKLEHKV